MILSRVLVFAIVVVGETFWVSGRCLLGYRAYLKGRILRIGVLIQVTGLSDSRRNSVDFLFQ